MDNITEDLSIEDVLQEINSRDGSLDEDEDPIVGIKLSQLKNILEQGIELKGDIQFIRSLGGPKFNVGDTLLDTYTGKNIKVTSRTLDKTNDPSKPWDWFYFGGFYGYPESDLKKE